MKILIIQLSRYADILQSYPAVKALRKQFPAATLHVLVRDRFRQAVCELDAADCIYTFAADEFLNPLFIEDDLASADQNLNQWIDDIRDQDYDRVINLTFSVLSSFIASSVARLGTRVSGYSRHSDGHLALTDDMSCYFYAQVGEQESNQKSLAELFCRVCDVPQKFFESEISKTPAAPASTQSEAARVTICVDELSTFAQESANRFSVFVQDFINEFEGTVCLVGSTHFDRWTEFTETLPPAARGRVENKVGQTQLSDLFAIAKSSNAIIGFDSVVLQVGFLTGTRAFVLTNDSANYFETVPRVIGTSVFRWDGADTSIIQTIQYIQAQISGVKDQHVIAPLIDQWTREGWLSGHSESVARAWTRTLLDTLYFRSPYVYVETSNDVHRALKQIIELCDIAIFQLNHIGANAKATAHPDVDLQGQILQRIDQTIDSVSRVVPVLYPLTAWFSARRISVGPAQEYALISTFKNIYTQFIEICKELDQESLDGTLRVG